MLYSFAEGFTDTLLVLYRSSHSLVRRAGSLSLPQYVLANAVLILLKGLVFILLPTTHHLKPLLKFLFRRVVLGEIASQMGDLKIVVSIGRIAAIDPVGRALQQLLGGIEPKHLTTKEAQPALALKLSIKEHEQICAGR